MPTPKTMLAIGAILCAGLVALYFVSRTDAPVGPVAASVHARVQPQEPAGVEQPAAPPTARAVPAEASTALAASAPASSTPLVPPAPAAPASHPVSVVVRTPSGESFRKATSTSPFMFKAVATRTEPGEIWPPSEGDPPIEPCGEMGFAGSDMEQGIIGSIKLRCAPPLWVSLLRGGRVIASQVLQPDQEVVVFTLDDVAILADRCTLRLRVVDQDSGAPLPNATIRLTSNPTKVHAEADAVFVIEEVEPGLQQLTAMNKGYDVASRKLDLEPGSEVDLGDLALRKLERHPLHVLVRRPLDAQDIIVRFVPAEWLRGRADPTISMWTKKVADEAEVVMRLDTGLWGAWAEGRSSAGTLRSATTLVQMPGVSSIALDLVLPLEVTLRGGSVKSRGIVRDGQGLWAHEMVGVPAGGDMRIQLVPGSYELVLIDSADEVMTFTVSAAKTTVQLP